MTIVLLMVIFRTQSIMLPRYRDSLNLESSKNNVAEYIQGVGCFRGDKSTVLFDNRPTYNDRHDRGKIVVANWAYNLAAAWYLRQ
jgi:hypothetical protein